MNISCTNNCIHQSEGVCTLTELPLGFTSSVGIGQSNENDCYYYEQTNNFDV